MGALQELLNPYYCDPDVCNVAQDKIADGADEAAIMETCKQTLEAASRDEDFAVRAASHGVPCGMMIAEALTAEEIKDA